MGESTEDKRINARFVAINSLVNLERKQWKQKIYEKITLFESKHMNN